MSIIDQQTIGSGNLRAFEGNENKDPFPKPDEWETEKAGFGGYRYAKDTEQSSLFGVNGNARRGPRWAYLGSAFDPVYGGSNGARPTLHQTLLGQLAQYIDPTRGADQDAWGTDTSAKQIAHSIMSSGQLKSLRDTTSTASATPGRPVYHASGGAFTGYDNKNEYGISSWTTEAVEGVEAVEAVEAVAAAAGRGIEAVAAVEGVDAVEGAEASNREIFRASNDLNTGLRRLPVSTTAIP